MKRKTLTRWIATVLKGVVITTSMASRVLASVFPTYGAEPVADLDTWNALRSELDKGDQAEALPAVVTDVINSADLKNDLREAVMLSYMLTQAEDIAHLDHLWVTTIVERGDSDAMAEYVSLRSNLQLDTMNSEHAYADWYLWEAQAAGGDCDGGEGGTPDPGVEG